MTAVKDRPDEASCYVHAEEAAVTWAEFDSPVGPFKVWLCEDCLDYAERTGTLRRRLSCPEAIELAIEFEADR